ncbi:hypothetical protein LH128_05268 [Sphingomonas sp. LH128]|uniref:hypothetical protein n=1 Tax=Sphingomonas sp. LH128 TaxID=473781 RepID=UPI00027C9B29|nr:hypothetical protein [Sphingomonas sp. LH128]EJU14142.1 hypothetical protein LH128_05268 [Sphingomonas sp. LH128]
MSVCKWHYEDGMRFLVPGCWNRVIGGDSAECHCVDSAEDDLRKQVRELQDQLNWMKLQMQDRLPTDSR